MVCKFIIFFSNQDAKKKDFVRAVHKRREPQRGEEGQPHQSLVRTTFSSFFRPNHLGILVLRLFCVKKFPIIEDKTIFFKSGHVRA